MLNRATTLFVRIFGCTLLFLVLVLSSVEISQRYVATRAAALARECANAAEVAAAYEMHRNGAYNVVGVLEATCRRRTAVQHDVL